MFTSRLATIVLASCLALASMVGASAADGGAAKIAQAMHINNTAPAYPHNIVAVTDITTPAPGRCGGGTYRLDTSDSVQTVAAWYRSHLPKKGDEVPNASGSKFFVSAHGQTTTIDLLPGNLAPHGAQILVGPC